MNYETNIDEILNQLIDIGSDISYLNELKLKLQNYVKKDLDLCEILSNISKEVKNETEEFLYAKNMYDINYTTGISTCIYLPDYNSNGEFKLKIIGGKLGRWSSKKIDDNTIFDVASITKLFTLILLFKLEELGLINLNDRICDINEDFQNLGDFTLNDLVKLHGELATNGNISEAKSSKEAYDILKTLYLKSNDRTVNKYNDFGAIVIGDTIEKVISKYKGEDLTLEDIMFEYLLKPMRLHHTYYNPIKNNISGNGNKKRLVHDRKAKKLGGTLGHAGIFTTSDDLAKLSKCLYFNREIINKKHLNCLGEITFPDSKEACKGNLGIYVKNKFGLDRTFTPSEFSFNSFSHQGWTGALACFDPNNLIHYNILVNSIYEDSDLSKVKNDKPVGYMDAFSDYQKELTKNTILMYVAKKYYNKYLNAKENIDIVKYL